MFAIEISDLTKIIKLNVEENQLKRELKDNSELKTDKSNNISQTHNEILLELNNLLKNEDNKISPNLSSNPLSNENLFVTNKKDKNYVFDDGKIILEENNETASILKSNKQFNIQSNVENEKSSIKSKNFIFKEFSTKYI